MSLQARGLRELRPSPPPLEKGVGGILYAQKGNAAAPHQCGTIDSLSACRTRFEPVRYLGWAISAEGYGPETRSSGFLN